MNDGKWVTINGKHIFIKDGQSPMDAFIKQKGGKSNKNKNSEISTKEKAVTGKKYRDTVKSLKGKEDGTYNLDTGERVDFKGVGYNVSFEQSSDNYTDAEYYEKIQECRTKCDGNVYGGVFGSDPEMSFYTKDKKVAMEIAKKYNQHSIWDVKKGDPIENPYYDEKKNKVNYKKK